MARKIWVFVLSLLLLFGVMFPLEVRRVKSVASMITVPDDYPTIQEAINNANEGDTVFVGNGTYYENVYVNKTISLVGESEEATVIDANYTGGALNVTANFVNVSGFTIQHGQNPDPFNPGPTFAGIYMRNANSTRVTGNIIQQNGMLGMYISYSNNCTVVNNTIRDNGYDGIEIWFSEYCLIDNNTLTGNGITAFEAIVSVAGGYNTISNNLVLGNTGGFWISNEGNDLIAGNIVRSNRTYNLDLWVAHDCLIKNNVFADSRLFGIYFEGFGGRNTICMNLIENNSVGVQFNMQNPPSLYNSFFLNNFVNNTVQAMIPTTTTNSTWDDGSKGNYWSNYSGVDVDGDGIGDTPYTVSGSNLDNYPLMEPYLGPHDVGSIIRASKTVLGEGYATTIALNVTARNYGEQVESFNLTFDMLGTYFETELNLASGDSMTFMFTLNTTGFTIGNYTIWSSASPVSGEEALKNNNCSLTIRVVIPGDVSGTTLGVPDGTVNMKDIAYLVSLFNTRLNSPNWDPNADVNNDGVCNMRDIAICVAYFNRHE